MGNRFAEINFDCLDDLVQQVANLAHQASLAASELEEDGEPDQADLYTQAQAVLNEAAIRIIALAEQEAY